MIRILPSGFPLMTKQKYFKHLCLFWYRYCCYFHFSLTALKSKPSFILPKFLTQRPVCLYINPFSCLVSNLCSLLPRPISLVFPAFFTQLLPSARSLCW